MQWNRQQANAGHGWQFKKLDGIFFGAQHRAIFFNAKLIARKIVVIRQADGLAQVQAARCQHAEESVGTGDGRQSDQGLTFQAVQCDAVAMGVYCIVGKLSR